MTAKPSIDPARMLHDQLASASPDLLEALEEPPSVKTRMCAVVGELNSACSLASRSSSYPTSSRANVAFDRA